MQSIPGARQHPTVIVPRQLAPVVELHGFRRRQTVNKLAIALMIGCLGLFTGVLVKYVVNPAIEAAAHSSLDAWDGSGR